MSLKEAAGLVHVGERHEDAISSLLYDLGSVIPADDVSEATLNEEQKAAKARLESQGWPEVQADHAVRAVEQAAESGGKQDKKDRMYLEALSWLVLNVAERDLPQQYRSAAADVTFHAGGGGGADADVLPVEEVLAASLVHLRTFGFDGKTTARALADAGNEEDRAARLLMQSLLPEDLCAVEADGSRAEELQDEVESLCAIYPDVVRVVSSTCWQLEFDALPLPSVHAAYFRDAAQLTEVFAVVTVQAAGTAYPDGPPLVFVQIPALHAEICRQLTERLVRDVVVPGVGDVIGFGIHAWMTDELASGETWEGMDLKILEEEARVTNAISFREAPKKQEKAPEAPSGAKGKGGKGGKGKGRRSGFVDAQRDANMNLKFFERTPAPKANPTPAIAKQRAGLPAAAHRDEIVRLLNDEGHQVLVISGETGCGKTTQVPQYLLEADPLASVVCTQPRRISAMSVAERVAVERGEKLGGTVGYQIRLENKRSARTRLLFCTTGVLLRKLIGDADLDEVSHVVVDEVHERGLDSDFLLIILRDLLRRRPTLKCILMSATVNADLFSNYFDGAPVLAMKGRTFPVQEIFLEDIYESTGYMLEADSPFALREKKKKGGKGAGGGRSALARFEGGKHAAEAQQMMDDMEFQRKAEALAQEYRSRGKDLSPGTISSLLLTDEGQVNMDLLAETVAHIDATYPPGGAILIFMTGLAEISSLYQALTVDERQFPAKRFRILALHSSLSSDDQRGVFARPPAGVRKVVIATNIAETSITIDDVVYVIDTGKCKENHYDPSSRMPSLKETWISRANARQRQGRAGRVQPGICFKTYTEERQMKMPPFQRAEILRSPLEGLILQIHSLGLAPVETFLARAIEPPPASAIKGAHDALIEAGALTKDGGSLTALGIHLASLPVSVKLGKMLIYACIFRCLDPVLTIASALAYKSPFASPIDRKKEASAAHRKLRYGASDHLTIWRAYREWERSSNQRKLCHDRFLSFATLVQMRDYKRQFVELLRQIRFLPADCRSASDERFNAHAHQPKIVLAVLLGGLAPNFLRIFKPKRPPASPQPPQLKTVAGGDVVLHPSSTISDEVDLPTNVLMYHELVRTSRVFARDASAVSPCAMLLMGGGRLEVDHENGTISLVLDLRHARFDFAASRVRGAVLIAKLRGALDDLLRQKVDHPDVDLAVEDQAVSTIVGLIADELRPDLDQPQK